MLICLIEATLIALTLNCRQKRRRTNAHTRLSTGSLIAVHINFEALSRKKLMASQTRRFNWNGDDISSFIVNFSSFTLNQLAP